MPTLTLRDIRRILAESHCRLLKQWTRASWLRCRVAIFYGIARVDLAAATEPRPILIDIRLTGAPRLLARRRFLQLPRDRIHQAFVLGRSFARSASPRTPCPGWSTRWSRVGVFGLNDAAQLWCAGQRPVVLALYLRGEPYHRIVCEVDDPINDTATINRWLCHRTPA